MPFDPKTLPIYAHEDEIVDAVRNHRVVVVEGETGSGKTTQLPRILLKADLAGGQIGITQPRRIAAVSVARRIAEEEGVTLGEEIGYAIRFDDKTSRRTLVKIMTDGILLQEARSDSLFEHYGVVMVDEAHERSLNIDLTLGLLYQALKKNSDLRVIISSATLKPEEFQAYFKGAVGDVPVISVSGRAYPVDVVYRPQKDCHWSEVPYNIARQVVQLHRRGEPGHILCFLTGQGMIERSVTAIEEMRPGKGLVPLPLYARLTREEQEQVFAEFGGKRKVILSTNIAETSITIPNVRYVIDCGLAKVPRYHPRTGITTLREEWISRASAAQRAGRAGRTAPGRVIRLYDKRDHDEQAEFTEEEIRRSDLSEVVLRLIDLGVSDVESFEFPTRPPGYQLRAAIRSLQVMGAIDERRHLTAVGKRMVPFPLSPPLARMVVEAAERHGEVMSEVLIVAAFLSSRPPYLFPLGDEIPARRAHGDLAHPSGDAMTAVGTFRAWEAARDRKAYCERNFLDPDVMAFVRKTHSQLGEIVEKLGCHLGSSDNPEAVLRCLATGFAERLLLRQGRSFETLGGQRASIHPSSAIHRTNARVIVAGELVESHRVWARQCSVVRAEWLPDLNPDAAKQWRIGGRGRNKKKRSALAELPKQIQIAGVTLQVKRRGKKPIVEILPDQVDGLRSAKLEDVPPECRRWPTRIKLAQGIFGSGCNLATIVEQLPHMPLPAADEQLERNVMEGVILDPDANWATIEPLLPKALTPMFPGSGKRPGWFSLVANGLGEFWFEVIHDFAAAAQSTGLSLNELSGSLDGAEERIGLVMDVQHRVDETLAQLQANNQE